MRRTKPKTHHQRLEVVWLDPKSLTVDLTYQREFDPKWADAILAAFDADQVRPIDVVDRGDGEYAIENGQHTHYVLKEKGWTLVPCFVRNGATSIQAEAEHFIQGNSNSKGLRALQLFRAALVVQHPLALDIQRIVESHGLVVAAGLKNGIHAVKALEEVYQRHGPDGLDETLRIILAAWDEHDRARLGSNMLRGLSYFLANNPKLSRERIILKLKQTSPLSLYRKARAESFGGEITSAMAFQIDKAYRRRGGTA